MAGEKVNITSPVARLVAGSLYKPNDKNFDGGQLVYKQGADAGKPRVEYFIAIAIPKTGETHWANTEWGSKIWAVGHKEFPQAALRPDFSWKVEDGDSQIPNKRNRKPCEQEGWPGHWIVKLKTSFALSIYKAEGSNWVQLTQPDLVKCGYYLQVGFSVDGNRQENNPGVYLNPNAICFSGYGPEINFGPNVEDYGFGKAAMPAGVSQVPLAAAVMPAGAPPPPSGAYPPPPPAPPVYAGSPPPPPVQVTPHPQFLQVPPPAPGGSAQSAVPASAVPPAPPSASVTTQSPSRRMTAAAGNVTYESYIKGGWTEAQMLQAGVMVIG